MRIRTQQRLARFVKPLQLHLMADPVARPGEQNTVTIRDRAQILMIVGIFKAVLQRVVIDVAH